MSILDRYLARLFFTRFVIMLAGLVAMALLIDFAAHADEVIASEGGDWLALVRYATLRLPQILSQVIALTTLLAVLLTLATLERHAEMVALWSTGMSQFRLIIALAPAAMLIAAIHFVIDDQAVPTSLHELRTWGVGEYGRGLGGEDTAAAWVRQGNSIVRIGNVLDRDRRLSNVTIFRRDDDGNLVERIEAPTAEYDGEIWTLRNVTRLNVADNKVTYEVRMQWDGRFLPSLLATLAAHPRELSFVEVKRFVDAPEFGNRPLYLYEAWLHEKIVRPLASILMLLLAVPLAQRFKRQGSIAPMLTVGVAIGFLYFMADGITLAAGEAGLIPPMVAAWAPTLIFACISGTIALHFEHR